MLDGKDMVKNENECYNCGCNLKPICPDYGEPKMKIRVTRLHEQAKMPVRAHATDAGMDLFFCPAPRDDIPKQIESVLPHGSSLFPTGLKIEVPEGYMLEIKNKSGIASKRQLVVGACVVDSGYDGEIFVNVHNVGKETQTVFPCDRIAQAVLLPVVHFRALETHEDNLYNWYPIAMSDRKAGGFGSTGT